MSTPIHALVVTFNRRDLLERCLRAIASQSYPPVRILVVDNGSTDDTRAWLEEWRQGNPVAQVIHSGENLGGAGGFALGMREAIASGCSYIWMMDDDAEPEASALEELANAGLGERIFGSVASADGTNLAWPLVSRDGKEFRRISEIPTITEVVALPFLGILIPRSAVAIIGLPNSEYFIAGDDTEYCFRARSYGIGIFAVPTSRLKHPSSAYYKFGIGNAAPICFRMPPWKRYYDVRNRILTSRKSGIGNVIFRTVPATIIRLLASLLNEPQRYRQLRAYYAGVFDGLLNRTGKRHEFWRIPQRNDDVAQP